jgi:hypothetical protein
MLRLGTFTLVLAAIVAQSAAASTISYLGTDGSVGSNGEAWRSTSVTKTSAYDPNGDNVYGSDGYYIAYSNTSTGSGTTANNVMSSLPNYVSGVTSAIASLKNGIYTSGIYGAMDNPSAGTSSTVANLFATGLWQAGNTDALANPFFTITLSSDATFILGVIVGTHNDITYDRTGTVTVSGSNGDTSGAIDVSSYTATASHADYVFFTISGTAGETITVSLTGYSGKQASSSGLTFETAVPEPATTVMALTGIAGLLAFAWRKRKNRK